MLQSSAWNCLASRRVNVYEVTTRSASLMASASGTPDLREVSSIITTLRPGTNFFASPVQAPITDVGAITREGLRGRESSCRRSTRHRVCSVLPRPMSSARMPPSPASHSAESQP